MAMYDTYYGMMGTTLFHALLMAAAVTLALALIIGGFKLVIRRVRGRNSH